MARLARVSTATVPQVLNDLRPVLPRTRQLVVDAIVTLRYRRDAIARSLRRSSTGMLGLIVFDISNPFFDLAQELENVAYGQPSPSNIILCNTDEHAAKEGRCLNLLRGQRVTRSLWRPPVAITRICGGYRDRAAC